MLVQKDNPKPKAKKEKAKPKKEESVVEEKKECEKSEEKKMRRHRRIKCKSRYCQSCGAKKRATRPTYGRRR